MVLSGYLSAISKGDSCSVAINYLLPTSRCHTSKALTKYLSFCSLFLLSYSGSSMADIVGSKHDFSTNGWSEGQICNVCHTPHSGANNVNSPLWSHAVSDQTYILYDSPTLISQPEQPQPGSISRLCLSCHDGTMALDSYGGKSGGLFMDPNSQAMLGTDLRNDHPVGISWDHRVARPDAGQAECIVCHDVFFPTKADAGKELRFFNGKVECASCHDVHNSKVMDVKLLRKPMQNSQLCQHCHFK